MKLTRNRVLGSIAATVAVTMVSLGMPTAANAATSNIIDPSTVSVTSDSITVNLANTKYANTPTRLYVSALRNGGGSDCGTAATSVPEPGSFCWSLSEQQLANVTPNGIINFKGLRSYTNYEISITAYETGGQESFYAITKTLPGAPDEPSYPYTTLSSTKTALQVIPQGLILDREVHDATPLANIRYNIYAYVNGARYGKVASNLPADKSHTITGLPANKKIYLTETAVNSTGESGESSPSQTFTLSSPSLNKISISKSAATVYPVKDGYRDSVKFTVKGATGTNTVLPVTGSAVLKKGSKTITTWKITKSTQTFTWNGKVKGKIQTGSYTFSATVKAALGGTHSASTKVSVSKRHLVSHSVTKRYSALQLFGKSFRSFSTSNPAQCYYNAYSSPYVRTVGAEYCQGGSADYQGQSWPYTAILTGKVSVPSAVRKGTSYVNATVTVTQTSRVQSGHADLNVSTSSASKTARVHNGRTGATVTLRHNQNSVAIQYGFAPRAVAGTKDYTVAYKYKTLG